MVSVFITPHSLGGTDSLPPPLSPAATAVSGPPLSMAGELLCRLKLFEAAPTKSGFCVKYDAGSFPMPFPSDLHVQELWIGDVLDLPAGHA